VLKGQKNRPFPFSCLPVTGKCWNVQPAVHNAFGKGLNAFGSDTEKLALELYYWFKHSAPHKQDFRLVQISFDISISLSIMFHVGS